MYAKIRNIYNQSDTREFTIAIYNILNMGVNYFKRNSVVEIPDDEYANKIAKLSREIVSAMDSPIEIMQFAEVMNLFDTSNYTGNYRIPYERLSEISTQAIWALITEDSNLDSFDYAQMMYDYDLDLNEEEMDFFDIPHDYEEDEDYEL